MPIPALAPGFVVSGNLVGGRSTRCPGGCGVYSALMTVRVLLFASYADAVGKHELALDLEDGANVGDVVDRVRALAGNHALPPAPLLALNAVYATADSRITAGDEVAIIPPVAGG